MENQDERWRFTKNKVKTLLSLYVSDVDFSSVYPSVMRGANIARDTFKSAVFALGHKYELDVQDISSCAINTKENAVSLCSKHMGLPDYKEFEHLLDEEFGENT